MEYRLLSGVKAPSDIKKMSTQQLYELCFEIRQKILETVSKNGGHLSSNLGAVELTVALHKVFDSPRDSIVFDVGHQCYAHKLITGRYENFDTLRKKAAFPAFADRTKVSMTLFTPATAQPRFPQGLVLQQPTVCSGMTLIP